MNIVIIEDESDIADLLATYCKNEGWSVSIAISGEKGLDLVRSKQPDFIYLDVGLKGDLNGFDVCKEIRQFSQVPILFLTARGDEVDRIIGLELGADDYVTKPFSPREVIVRTKNILKRGKEHSATSQIIDFGNLRIDLERKEVRLSNKVVVLTSKELELLSVFVENLGIALSREQLLDKAWGEEWFGDERTVDVHVRQLRKKLGDELPLATLRGHGYRLD